MGNPFNGYWTGWTEFEMEDEEMKDPPSKPIKRKAEDDHDEEDQQATQHRQLDMEQDEEMSEVNDI
eukprot:6346743-Pyramimonas_sp.AAC.1